MDHPVSISAALRHGAAALQQAGIAAPRLTAEVLLADVLGRDKAFLYAHWEDTLEPHQREHYARELAERSSGKPTQYITGVQEFFGLPFRVTQDVLIPRPETELLVEQALARAKSGHRVLDVGTGSGAIAIAIQKQLGASRVYAGEISAGALAVAKDNARRLGSEVQFIQADLVEAFRREAFDLVVSNPPYVPRNDLSTLQREVRDYEPHVALFGGGDGLEVYQRLSATAQSVLKPGAWLLLEVGYNTSSAIKPLFGADQWDPPLLYCDLAGWERVMAVRKRT